MNVTLCPEREHLESYVLGKLTSGELDSIAEHLLTCSECDSAVAGLENASDSLVAELRSPPLDDAFEQEPILRQTLDVLRARFAQVGVPLPACPPVPAARLGKPTVAPANDQADLGSVREYRLLAKIGQGGMGAVYKAVHTRLKRVVAIKLLPDERMHDEAAVRRFAREMEAVGKLEHPHIVKALDAGEDAGRHFLVMEYVEGLDLARLSRARGPLPVAEACELVRQAAVGLQHAHEHGLVHRDVKPSNLLLAKDGQVKVLDLGLARLHGDRSASDELTATGQVMGTRLYMAPEQFDDTRGVDIRADVYGLGATLETLITGEVPPIRAHQHPALEPLTPILDRMLARDPRGRFATPAEVAEVLAPYAAGADLTTLLDRADGVTGSEQRDGPGAALQDDAGAQFSPSPHHGGGSGWGGRPQIGRRRPRFVAIATSFLALAALTAAAFVVRIATDRGELVIESPEPGIEVVLKRAGRFYDGLELQPGENRTTLRAGQYEVQIVGNTDGLRVEDNQFTLTRGGEAVVTIRRKVAREGGRLRGVATEEPLYEGKTFFDWQAVLKTERSPERLAQAVRGLVTLGANGREQEAARAILQLMREHDSWIIKGDAYGQFLLQSIEALNELKMDELIPAVISELEDGNTNSRMFVCRALTLNRSIKNARAAVPSLLKLTKDADYKVRYWALALLATITPVSDEAVRAIQQATQDENEEVRKVAANLLKHVEGSLSKDRQGRIDNGVHESQTSGVRPRTDEPQYNGKTFSQWLSLLKTERNPEHLRAAPEALAVLAKNGRAEEAAKAILQATRGRNTWDYGDDPEGHYILAVKNTLNRMESAAVFPALIEGIERGDESVRVLACDIINLRDDEPGAEVFVPSLLTMTHDPSPRVRALAVAVLSVLDPNVPGLVGRVEELLNDENSLVLEGAVSALSRVDPNHERLISGFVRFCMKADGSLRRGGFHQQVSLLLQRGLGARAHEAVPALIEALENEDPNVRRRVLYALAEIEPVGEGAIAAFKKAMLDQDLSVRKSATFLYEQQQSPRARLRRSR